RSVWNDDVAVDEELARLQTEAGLAAVGAGRLLRKTESSTRDRGVFAVVRCVVLLCISTGFAACRSTGGISDGFIEKSLLVGGHLFAVDLLDRSGEGCLKVRDGFLRDDRALLGIGFAVIVGIHRLIAAGCTAASDDVSAFDLQGISAQAGGASGRIRNHH